MKKYRICYKTFKKTIEVYSRLGNKLAVSLKANIMTLEIT